MAYPGNPELSPQAQDRVMSAFKQVVDKLQQGNREEALIGIEFVLRLDPAYAPALNLHEQLSSGAAEIDLNEVVSQLQAPTTDAINSLVVEAVEDFNNRDFSAAREKLETVLLDLPGHAEARALMSQIEEADKGTNQVGQFLSQARDALGNGNSQEAANFVMMAQALDPHHPEIATTIAEIEKAGGMSMAQAGFVADPAETQKISFEEPADGGVEFAAAETADLFAETPETDDGPATGEVSADTVPDFDPPPADNGDEETSLQEGDDAAEAVTGFATEEPYYEAPADGVADLFDAGPTTFEDAGAEIDPDDSVAAIRALLAKGGEAAAADRYAEAIDAWSRVLLIDHGHEEALDRIGHIRHAMEELERRVDPMLVDAEAALESGDVELARDFAERVLSLWPRHVEATRLQEKINRGAPPKSATSDSPAAPEMPDLEDELFTDEFATTSDFGAEVARTSQTLEGEWRTPDKPKRRIPWQWWVVIGATATFVISISLWVAGVFAPDAPEEARITVVNRVLVEAAELYNLKKIDEAIVLLEENSSDDQFQVRINNRLSEYRKMVATPVPTPVPAGLAACRELVAGERWIAAYERVMLELQISPNDPSLEEVREQVLAAEPDAANLYRAMASSDYRAALGITRDLFDRYPEDADLQRFYDRSLFNAGLSELRAFNLSEAEVFLSELKDRQPDDEEVPRMLEFIELYKARPVDMQLEIFVGSIDKR